jgi:hypothetical protein
VCRVPDKQEKPSEDWHRILPPRSFGNAGHGRTGRSDRPPAHAKPSDFNRRTGRARKSTRRLGRSRPSQTGSGLAERGFAASLGAGFAAAAANGIRKLGHVCNWETQDWDDLTDAERQAFQILGWSRATWDGENEGAVASSKKGWSELTPKERKAAQSLGYSAHDWDVVCPRDIPE